SRLPRVSPTPGRRRTCRTCSTPSPRSSVASCPHPATTGAVVTPRAGRAITATDPVTTAEEGTADDHTSTAGGPIRDRRGAWLRRYVGGPPCARHHPGPRRGRQDHARRAGAR